MLNILGGLIPDFLWRQGFFLRLLGRLGGFMGAGEMSLTGRLPNGQWFISNPRSLWVVTATEAVVRGEVLGERWDLSPSRPGWEICGFPSKEDFS